MRLELPHRNLRFTEADKSLPCEEKVELVNKILQEEVSEGLTLEMHLYNNFDNKQSIVTLDKLAYFIAKEHRQYQDIMTRKTVGKMQKGDGRTTPFSSMSYSEQVQLGIADEDSGYN